MRPTLKPRPGFKSFLCDSSVCCRRATRVVRSGKLRWEMCKQHAEATRLWLNQQSVAHAVGPACDRERFGDYCAVCEREGRS